MGARTFFNASTTSGLTAGRVYYMASSTVWTVADNTGLGNAYEGFMGVSMGTNASSGFVIEGCIYMNNDPGGSVGDPVYLSTSGNLTVTVPTGTGDAIRLMGHKIATNVVYFRPSNDWIIRS